MAPTTSRSLGAPQVIAHRGASGHRPEHTLGAYVAARYIEDHTGVSRDDTYRLATRLVVAGVIGARLTWDISHWSDIHSPLDLIAVWKGGLQFSGGFILAVIVGIPTFRQWSKADRWSNLDGYAFGLTIGLALGRGDPAQQGAQPGQQLGQREGLGQVVVGPGVEALDPVAHGVAGGEHEDGDVVAGRAQGAGRLEPAEPRHHHVHHDDVGPLGPDGGQRLGAVGGEHDVVAVELQAAPQRLAHRLVVVDDEDAVLGVGRGAHGPTLPRGSERALRVRGRVR